MIDREQEHLEALKEELYERKPRAEPLRRSGLRRLADVSQTDWRRVEPLRLADQWLSFKFLKKILWWALAFFILMVGIALFVSYRGSNLVSAGNIEIKVGGPETVAAGQELTLQVAVTNKNNVSLELADLIVEYPAGTRVAGEVDQALARERFPLGEIDSNETVNQTVRAVLFSEKDSIADLKMRVEYRLADSSAIFDRSYNYPVRIGSTPLVLILDLPKEINSNQEIVLNTQIQSNAESQITNPTVIFTYPAGFRFIRSAPAPTHGQNVWKLSALGPGDKKTIQVVGTLEGQDEEQKSFRVAAGIVEDENDDQLAATYGSNFATLTIKRPFVGLTSSINGDPTSNYAVTGSSPIRFEVGWTNNLATEITDGQVLVTLNGRPLDKLSVAANRGYYNSTANTVLWSKLNQEDLASIPSGGSGRVNFDFSAVSFVNGDGADLRQPEMTLNATFKGKRINEDGKTEEVSASVSKKIIFNSTVQLAGRVLARTGPFTNRGPIPPKVGEETTYTIEWSILNSSNNLERARVVANLPPYVKWLGVTQPSAEGITFQAGDSAGGGQVIWDLGQVNAGVGTKTPARTVYFQVGLNPSLSQVGESPVLVTEPTLSAFDTFTKQDLTAKLRRSLDTELSSETGFKFGDERVTQ